MPTDDWEVALGHIPLRCSVHCCRLPRQQQQGSPGPRLPCPGRTQAPSWAHHQPPGASTKPAPSQPTSLQMSGPPSLPQSSSIPRLSLWPCVVSSPSIGGGETPVWRLRPTSDPLTLRPSLPTPAGNTHAVNGGHTKVWMLQARPPACAGSTKPTLIPNAPDPRLAALCALGAAPQLQMCLLRPPPPGEQRAALHRPLPPLPGRLARATPQHAKHARAGPGWPGLSHSNRQCSPAPIGLAL